MNELGEYIRNARLKKGLTQRMLGNRSDISHQYIAELEKGYLKNPSMKMIKSLVKHLDLDLNEFMKKA